jgi:hypothetical protein
MYDASLWVMIIWFPKPVPHTAYHKVLLSCLIERERTVIAVRPNSVDPPNLFMWWMKQIQYLEHVYVHIQDAGASPEARVTAAVMCRHQNHL